MNKLSLWGAHLPGYERGKPQFYIDYNFEESSLFKSYICLLTLAISLVLVIK